MLIKRNIKICLLYCIFILIAFLISCKSKNEKDSGRVSLIKSNASKELVVEPQENNKESFNLSSVIDTFFWVPLETKPESIIGDAFTVSLARDRVVIFDGMRSIGFTFSIDGKFLFHSFSNGRGPEEVPHPMSIYYDEQLGKLLIPDSECQCLHIIDTSGVYIKRIKVGHYISHIARTGPEHHALFSYDSEVSNLLIANGNLSSFLETNIKLTYTTPTNINPFYQQQDGSAYFTYRLYDTILNISSDRIELKYLVNSKNHPDKNFKSRNEREIHNKLRDSESNIVYDVNNIYETDDLLLYNYTFKSLVHQVIYSKTNNTALDIIRKHFAGYILGVFVPCGDGWFYSRIYQYEYPIQQNLNDREAELNLVMKGRRIDDNPVLLFFKLKSQ